MRVISFTIFFFIQLILLSFILVTIRSLCIQERHLLMCQSQGMVDERIKWQKENTVWEEEPLCLKQWERLNVCTVDNSTVNRLN